MQSLLQSSQVGNMNSRGFNNNTEIVKDDEQWMRNLSTRENIFYGYTPYMPILMEDIPNYIKLDDFEFNRIKEIQTVGIVLGYTQQEANLYNSNPDNHTFIQLSFDCCKYTILQQNGYALGLKIPFKVFGRLVSFKEKPIIEVHHLLKTDDLENCLKTTTMLSQLVRQKYHYYTGCPDTQL